MKKKILSVILALVMIAGMIPLGTMSALADTSHAHDGITFTAWTSETSLPTTAGSYYLTKDVTLSATWEVPADTVNLCLNGHVIKANSTGFSVITVDSGAALNIYDCGETEHAGYVDTDGLWHLGDTVPDGCTTKSIIGGVITGGVITGNTSGGGGVYVEMYSSFTLNSGSIAGNTASSSHGGGVYVDYGGTFTMSGGSISDNRSTGSGGGVYVEMFSTFTMSGGSISGNTATGGGGVYVNDYGSFTMSGGSISGNTAGGGGVWVNGGSFTMSGGSISGNTAGSYDGGGVYVNIDSNFTMNGGSITGNTATKGGGVCVDYGSFTMNDGSITGNTATGNYGRGGGVYVSNSTFTMSGGSISGNEAGNNGGGVYTTNNITLGGTAQITGNKKGTGESATDNNLYLPSGKTVTLGTKEGENVGNGVAVPVTEGATKMQVGVTPQNVTDTFTGAAAAIGAACFTSDNADYDVRYDNNSTPENETDDSLKFVKIYAITNGAPQTSVSTNHGYLTVDKTTAAAGETVTVTVTPSDGYQLKADSLKATYNDGSEDKTITLTQDETDTTKYTFTMPDYAVTVTAEFEEIQTPAVAKIGDIEYATLADAIAAAQNDDTIILLADAVATKTGDYGFEIKKGITLDLNGKTLSNASDNNYFAVHVTAGNVTIKNGTITSSADATVYVAGNIDVTFDSVTLQNTVPSATSGYGLYVTNKYGAVSLSIKGTTNLYNFYNNANNKSASVEAGTYNFDPTDYVDSTEFDVDSTSAPDSYVVKALIPHNVNAQVQGSHGQATVKIDSAAVTQAKKGAALTFTATADNGYEFDHWEVVSGSITLSDTDKVLSTLTVTMPDTALTLKAYFKAIIPSAYNIIVETDGHGTASANPTSAASNATVTLTATPTDGYAFKEWEIVRGLTSGDITDNSFTMPTNEVKVKAIFEKVYNVTVEANGHGSASASVASGVSGTEVSLTITPDNGYEVDQINVVRGGVTVNDKKFNIGTADVKIQVTFKAIIPSAYNIIVEDDGHGTASANPTSAASNATVTLTATPDSGYAFKEWQVIRGGVTITDNKFTMPANEVKVKAIFERVYNINIQDDGHGTASAKIGDTEVTAAAGGKGITLVPTADDGYEFDKWEIVSGDFTITDNGFTMPTSNVTIKATFKFIKGDQTAPAEGEGYTVDRENGKIIPKEGYEIRGEIGKFAAKELPLRFDVPYFVRKAETSKLNPSPETKFIIAGCEYTETVSLVAGIYGMKLGGKDMGEFTFAQVSGGWSIYNGSKYLAMQDGKLILSDTAFAWTYKNGAFSVSTSAKTTQKTGGRWFGFIYIPGSSKTVTVTTTYYLSTVTNGDKLSTKSVKAELYVEASGAHEWSAWTDCKDGTNHKRVCKNCGEVETKAHSYDPETHKCVCGAYDPTKTNVTISVDVKAKTTKQYSGFLFWGTWKNVTTYTATIKTEANGTKVTKVQYQLNGSGKWITGTSVSSDKPIETLNVKAWDSNGTVTEYTYPVSGR